MRHDLPLAGLLALIWAAPTAADQADAACEIYPAGSDRLEKMVPCHFAQTQGHVTITLADGTVYDLSPFGDAPGNFRDAEGRAAYRQSGLGDQGLIFRLREVSIFVYWDTSALHPDAADNPTAPFSTKDYDATTLLPCRGPSDSAFGRCPAGVLRMEDGQASVVVQSPAAIASPSTS
jgi:hypothetical protein